MGSGEAREMWTTTVTLPAGVTVGQFYYRITSDLYAFCVIFCNIGVVLFLYYDFFCLILFFEETLPPLPTRRKRPWLVMFVGIKNDGCLLNMPVWMISLLTYFSAWLLASSFQNALGNHKYHHLKTIQKVTFLAKLLL